MRLQPRSFLPELSTALKSCSSVLECVALALCLQSVSLVPASWPEISLAAPKQSERELAAPHTRAGRGPELRPGPFGERDLYPQAA